MFLIFVNIVQAYVFGMNRDHSSTQKNFYGIKNNLLDACHLISNSNLSEPINVLSNNKNLLVTDHLVGKNNLKRNYLYSEHTSYPFNYHQYSPSIGADSEYGQGHLQYENKFLRNSRMDDENK
jgi:hypothetical protein